MDPKKVTAMVKIMLSIRRYEEKLKSLKQDAICIGRTLTHEEQQEYMKRMQ